MASNEQQPTCVVVSPATSYHGKQQLDYFAGVCAQTAGARGLCMHLLTIPPGGRSEPHLHERHETAVYVLSGEGAMYYGEGLKQHLTVGAGQFLYIPPSMPHLTYNPSDTTPCVAIIARTDPDEQESVKRYEPPV